MLMNRFLNHYTAIIHIFTQKESTKKGPGHDAPDLSQHTSVRCRGLSLVSHHVPPACFFCLNNLYKCPAMYRYTIYPSYNREGIWNNKKDRPAGSLFHVLVFIRFQ